MRGQTERVTLIGMPGSGKSSVGRLLAAGLGWQLIDTDRAIEERQGLPLQSVIDQVGEERFEVLEEETVLGLSLPERCVISTGGSVVYSDAAMERLSSLSMIVFLDAGLAEIRTHIGWEAPRGIVGLGAGGLEALFDERLPRYRRYADLVITCGAGETPAGVAARVIGELQLAG